MDDSRLPPVDDDAGHVRRQLILRGAIAAGLIVALLAALVIFERNQTAEQPPEPPPTAKTITPIGPSLSTGIDTQSSALSDQSVAVTKPLEGTDADGTLLSENQSSLPVAVPEGSSDPTAVIPDTRLSGPRVATGKTPRLVVEQSGAKAPPPKTTPPPAATTNAGKPPPLPLSSPPPVTPAVNATNSFFVQLGVFSNPANAEELRARLDRNGIAAHVETRVQLGPFKTKQEAVAAQEKLRKLGLNSGMLITPKK